MANSLNQIQHIVVLMLENRSFDNILGMLYPNQRGPSGQFFNGLTGNEINPLDPATPAARTFQVWNNGQQSEDSIPTPDPGEAFSDMYQQIYGVEAPASYPISTPAQPGSMQGFVWDYLQQPAEHGANPVARDIMHYFTDTQVPVSSTLARQFAVVDDWYGSVPAQTWPNRSFLHCATSGGFVNNEQWLPEATRNWPSLFEQLDKARPGTPSVRNWKIYYHDLASTWIIQYVTDRFLERLVIGPRNVCNYDYSDWGILSHGTVFKEDVASGNLPQYSFIEPRYNAFTGIPSDNHPPHDVTYGEMLLADVYNTLISNPAVWQHTLLVATYDEHGGCYDHQPPPHNATPPDDKIGIFDFKSFGPRVPALLVSPYIPSGTIFRSNGSTPFDHTSVIRTVRKCFCPDQSPLTRRDTAAPTFDDVLSLPAPTNNPGPVTPPAPSNAPDHLQFLRAMPPSALGGQLLMLRDAVMAQGKARFGQ